MKRIGPWMLFFLTTWLLSTCAFADEIFPIVPFIDPATLHFGPGYGLPCATGCAGDPNWISSNRLDIYQEQGGADFLRNPLLLILAVPNDSTGSELGLNSISSVTSYNPIDAPSGVVGSWSFGAAHSYYGWSGSGFNGYMTSSSPEIFDFLGLDGPHDSSNSFTNFAGTEQSRFSITADGFGIYVFALTTSLGPKGLVDVQFSWDLPTGTIAAAFGETAHKVYANPYTEVGIAPPSVPEPSSLLLLGAGLFGVAITTRRRKS